MRSKSVFQLSGRPLVWIALFAALFSLIYSWDRLNALPQETLTGCMTAVIRQIDDDRLFLRDATIETANGNAAPDGDILATVTHPCGCELKQGMIVQAEVTLLPLQPAVNPHGWDDRTWLISKGVVYRCEGTLLAHSADAPFSLRNTMRQAVTAHIHALWPEEGGLISALLLGTEDRLSEETQEAFRRSGAAHLMAVSGLHVGFVAALASLLFCRIKKNSWPQIALIMLCMAAYSLLAESAFSVYRAIVMLLMGLLAHRFGRKPDGLTALAVAVITALVFDPMEILRPGFLMSVCSVLGILLLCKRIETILQKFKLPAFLRSSIAVSISAQLGVAPVQLYVFHTVNLLSLITNLAAVPLAAGIVMAGLPSVLLHMITPALSLIPGFAVKIMARMLTLLCESVAEISFAQISLSSPPIFVLICWMGLLFLCSPYLAEVHRKLRLPLLIGILCAFSLSLVLWLPGKIEQERIPKVTFLSVGTADSAIFCSSDGNFLVDTGWSGSQATAYLQGEGRNADAVFLTHRDGDHAGGLAKVLQSAQVGAVMIPKGMNWEGLEEAQQILQEKEIPVIELCTGDRTSIGAFSITVLSPQIVSDGEDNADSLVLQIDCQGHTLLMTGDITAQTEHELVLPDCDVLKVPHHGSATGTGNTLLQKARPEIAVISVGTPNRYGFPRQEVLERLKSADVETHRTDAEGAIVITLGEEIDAKGYRPPTVWENLFLQ